MGIAWRSLEAGKAEALTRFAGVNEIGFDHGSNKPIMVVIHKTWCGACKGVVHVSSRIFLLSRAVVCLSPGGPSSLGNYCLLYPSF